MEVPRASVAFLWHQTPALDFIMEFTTLAWVVIEAEAWVS